MRSTMSMSIYPLTAKVLAVWGDFFDFFFLLAHFVFTHILQGFYNRKACSESGSSIT